jgi:hypothetical protein
MLHLTLQRVRLGLCRYSLHFFLPFLEDNLEHNPAIILYPMYSMRMNFQIGVKHMNVWLRYLNREVFRYGSNFIFALSGGH